VLDSKIPQRAQPLSSVAIIKLGTQDETAVTRRRTASSYHGPLCPKDRACAAMVRAKRGAAARRSKPQKTETLSSDRSLKLDSVKVESLVIAHQHGAEAAGVEYATGKLIRIAKWRLGLLEESKRNNFAAAEFVLSLIKVERLLFK